jgi:hypothetical protein
MPIPANMELYNTVKEEVYKKYTKPSAYRSGAVIKEYKKRGGEYLDDGKEKKLKRWFKEDWKDVNPDKTDDSYPLYRPTKRITKDSPLTVSEVDPKNLKEQAKLKQKIKGDANLPEFKAKDEKEGYAKLIGLGITEDILERIEQTGKLKKEYHELIKKHYNPMTVLNWLQAKPKGYKKKEKPKDKPKEKKLKNKKTITLQQPLEKIEPHESVKTIKIGGSIKENIKEVKRVIKRKAKNTIKDIKKVVEKRKDGIYPPAMRKLLAQIGDEKINKLVVIRTPLNDFTRALLSLISLNEFNNAVNKAKYDKMFHLALFINDKFILDKQEVLKLVPSINAIKDNTEKMDVPLNNQTISLNAFLDKTKQYMGDYAFTNYQSRYNNCQDFVIACLKSNDLLTNDLENFIKQDANRIFENMPAISERIANWLTDAGAVVEKLIEGEGEKKPLTKVRQKYRTIRYLTSGHGIKVLDSDDNEIVIKITKRENNDEENKPKPLTSWKAYVSENLKHKKLGSLTNVNEKIKELAKEWKAMKAQKE